MKPWAHLRDSVRNMHRRLNDITQCFPINFCFQDWQTADGTEYIRVYFLMNKFIYYCDSPRNDRHHTTSNNNSYQSSPSTSSGSTKHHHQRHHYHHHHHHHSSRERIGSSSSNKRDVLDAKPLHPNSLLVGNIYHIDSFTFDSASSRFVFAIDKYLYYFDDHPGTNEAPHVPTKIETRCFDIKTDFQICPSNPDIISFCCNGDIWCVNIKTSETVRLTDVSSISSPSHRANGNPISLPCHIKDNHSISSLSSLSSSTSSQNESSTTSSGSCKDYFKPDSAPFLVGQPSHVIKEEFRRHQGYWWRPETDYHVVNYSEDYSEYQLLYEETDQSLVEVVSLPSMDGCTEDQRFPKAGKANPKSKLKIIKFKLSTREKKIYDLVNCDVEPPLNEIFPGYEYLLRAGWLGQEAIWCQLLNRDQTHLVIVLISLTGSFESQIIYEERNDTYWVRVHDIFHFLNASKVNCQPITCGSELTFLWSSEETGYRHLYFIRVKLGNKESSCRLIMKRQLTEGPWEINDKDLWVDEEEMLIYFCGLRDTPLEKQLYTLSYVDCINDKYRTSETKTKIHRLTESNYTQSNIAFDASCSIFINIQSNISVPPFGFVNRIVTPTKFRRDSRRLPDSKRIALLIVNSYNYPIFQNSNLSYMKSIGTMSNSLMYDCPVDLLPGLTKPELFCCQLTSGELIYGSVFKPEFMESGMRYPTVLEIYGGPEIQLVTNNFMNLRHPTRHLLSSEGYVVVLIDCRGSSGRGVSFEAHTHKRMGQVEIADQVEVLKWLAKNTGYIDLNRVAIKGWSYGGYLALMALAQYPKVFKIAIAGAPVTNWHMYDSAYTERFMGSPSQNPDGYYKGNVLNYVHMFPDQ